jgi:predicted phage terminase large subunit-like protein
MQNLTQSKPSRRLPTLARVQVEQARRRLDRYVTWCDQQIIPARHHRLLIEQLHAVGRRELRRLAVFWPPGHAKSTYASHYGPAWLIGSSPRLSTIHCSHTLALAERFGRKIRNTLQSAESTEVFGTTVSQDNRAAGRWETLQGGEYYAAGVGGAIAGRRADRGIIDDPVKSRKDADSPTQRETTWQWYIGDFRTRLKPGASIVLIQTRWHEDDLAGRILPADYDGRSGWVRARDGEEWYVLNFPAVCERADDLSGREIGEPLWPEWIDADMLTQEKASQGSRNWDALYQQRPRPSDGGIFKEAWCATNRYRVIPAEANAIVHSWDTAQKPGELNDPSVGTAWRYGRGVPGYYLADVFRRQLDYPTLRRTVISWAERDRPSAVLIEDKSSGQSLIQELRQTTSLPVIPIEPQGDKTFRANEVSALVEAGLLHLPETAPWLVDYEGELFGFPLSTHDDQVDSTTQFLKWVHGRAINIDSRAAGMTRSNATQVERRYSGYGSVRRTYED